MALSMNNEGRKGSHGGHGGHGAAGRQRSEDRNQKAEVRSPNCEPQTSNPELRTITSRTSTTTRTIGRLAVHRTPNSGTPNPFVSKQKTEDRNQKSEARNGCAGRKDR